MSKVINCSPECDFNNQFGINAKFIPVDQITEPEKWLQLRTTGIGGSDVGAIMGLNKYASPLTVYMQKKGVEGFAGNLATEWGHILENPIRVKTGEELGIDMYTVPGMFTSNVYNFMNANVDGLCYAHQPLTIRGETVVGIGGHEIKTSSTGDGFTEDEIPDSYYCQVQHYMAVTCLSWFILTVFFMNTKKGAHYIIKRNEEFISKMIEAEKNFWFNVLENKAPEPIGLDSETEYLKSLPMDETIQIDSELEAIIENERQLDSKIKELSKAQAECKNKILLKLAESSIGFDKADKTTALGEKYKITYNLQTRKLVDLEALKKDGIYDKYCKESASKVMRISELKK